MSYKRKVLDDEQLKTPIHDKMVCYLLNKNNLGHIPEIREFRLNFYNCLAATMNPNPFDAGAYTVVPNLRYEDLADCLIVESEVPIETVKGNIIGFWDIVIKFDIDKIHTLLNKICPDSLGEWIRRKFDDYNFLVTYIEVKPEVYSFGSTLRQLNKYDYYTNKQNLKKGIGYYIWLTTLHYCEFEEEFRSQGYSVIYFPYGDM